MEDNLTHNVLFEINHDFYRFAYDLVEKVLEIRGELNPYVSHNLPEPSTYLFTKKHAKIIKNLLEKDTTCFLRQIHQITNGVYNYETYLTCREFFVSEWQKRAYTEKSFISACASIAYVAALFIQTNFHCGALDEVVEYIAGWIEYIFERGTIDNSNW